MMLINCSHCHTLLQLPSGVSSMRCTICKSITYVSDFWGVPMPLGASHSVPHPSPSWGLALPPMPGGGGRKKAVICGVTYRNTRNELMGSINGAKCMKYLLINRFSFPESNIIMLTEDERDPYKIPTKHNIRMAMYWLVQGCQPGDSLVFFYSGHGSQRRDYSGEEADGYDETLCPLDFRTQGMIVDNEINATMVRPLSRGVKLLAIIDACHSGTMLDLPYLCRMNSNHSSTMMYIYFACGSRPGCILVMMVIGYCLLNGVGTMHGKIIAQEMVLGKVLVVEKSSHSVVVMTIKLLYKPRLYQGLPQQVP
nr:PREDICTED: metacaspase-1-like isoform X2 [Musa acuminata subsp. malaccensis]